MDDFIDRSSWGLIVANAHAAGALALIGWLLVLGCLIGAVVVVVRYGQWVAALVLCVVAIVAAYLLL